ncbi:diaminopimelate epimerase [bacterium]|nr:diaminopimelate epimerase [bacterium]
MKKFRITKMQGCGNDFVIADYPEYKKSELEMSKFAKKICDRNFGIGADGLIIPNTEEQEADIGWYFYNSDGSTAQMCGNGMRCFAKYAYDNSLVNKKEFTVKTLAGIIKPSIQDNGTVRVNMGKPILTPEKIPCKFDGCIAQKINIENKEYTANAVSMGNPHCIIFTDDDIMHLAKNIGPKLEKSELFPEKTNVEFVNIKSRNEADMRVWERGCGITLACGTGACATTVAAILNNLTDNKVKINLLGGSLTIEWQGSYNNSNKDVFLTGPAEYTFFAEYLL